MAVILKRQRALFAKIESTAYTKETLAAADGDFNVYNHIIQATIPTVERPAQNSMSSLPDSSGARMGTCTFRCDFAGDGAGGVPEWASTFLPACGMYDSGSGTFVTKTEAPDAAGDIKALTMEVYNGGIVKGLRGAMGTFSILLVSGMPTFIDFTFTGAWIAPRDASSPSPTYPTDKPLRYANDGFTLGGNALCVQSATIDINNEIVMLPCQNQSDGTGYKGAVIANRNPTCSINPETDLVANQDNFGDWIAETTQAAVWTLSDATDTVTMTFPKAQIINDQEGDRDGAIVTDELTLKGTSETGADNDFTITFA